MAWKIEVGCYRPSSHPCVFERVSASDDPRSLGEALTGGLAGHWRYRVGDYRIIARIENAVLIVVVVEVGHRREVYR